MGVYDAEEPTARSAGVPAADGVAGACWMNVGGVVGCHFSRARLYTFDATRRHRQIGRNAARNRRQQIVTGAPVFASDVRAFQGLRILRLKSLELLVNGR